MASGKFKTRKSTKVKPLKDNTTGTKVIAVVNSDMVAFVWNDHSHARTIAKEMARVITAHAHLATVQQAIPDDAMDDE